MRYMANPCKPNICMYIHAHAREPLITRHHVLMQHFKEMIDFFPFQINYYIVSYCSCYVIAILASCPPPPPSFSYHAHLLHL